MCFVLVTEFMESGRGGKTWSIVIGKLTSQNLIKAMTEEKQRTGADTIFPVLIHKLDDDPAIPLCDCEICKRDGI